MAGHWQRKYVKIIGSTVKHPRRIAMYFCIGLLCIFILHRFTPTSFLPVEDQGYFTVELELPESATLERTRNVTERAIAFLMEQPAVEYVQNVTGSSPRVAPARHAAS